MKKILLIGSNSFVGKNIASALKGYQITGTYHNKKNQNLKRQVKLDITKKTEVITAFKEIKPDIIIILSAVSSSKEKKEKIKKLNIDSVKNIILSVKKLKVKSKIIFFSSDQIFDGKKGIYLENDKPNPINEYGKSKLNAERVVLKDDKNLVLRCSLILGSKAGDDHENFATNFLKSKDKTTIFKDVYRTPIYVKDIGRIIKKLIEIDKSGVVNIGGDDYLSFFEMAKKIEKTFNTKKEYTIINCNDKTVPKRLGLNNNLVKNLIDFKITSFNDMLADMKKQTGEI